MTTSSPAAKNVAYDGGALRFRIPADWQEGREHDGEAAFYPPGGGALRVKVLTFTSEEEIPPEAALAELEGMEAAPGQTLETLPSGNALRAHRDSLGDGTELHVWILASVDPPNRMHLAIFSYTTKTEDVASLTTRQLVAAIGREVRAASFSHERRDA